MSPIPWNYSSLYRDELDSSWHCSLPCKVGICKAKGQVWGILWFPNHPDLSQDPDAVLKGRSRIPVIYFVTIPVAKVYSSNFIEVYLYHNNHNAVKDFVHDLRYRHHKPSGDKDLQSISEDLENSVFKKIILQSKATDVCNVYQSSISVSADYITNWGHDLSLFWPTSDKYDTFKRGTE
jgi:hypothetical protein